MFEPEIGDYSEDMAMSRSHLIPELLRMLGYDLPAIGEIIDHVIIYGTAEGCPEFRNEEDRRAVEDMLPDAPKCDWDYYDLEWSPITLVSDNGSRYR